jgi:transcriptional regulator with XRE-family HTH domain
MAKPSKIKADLAAIGERIRELRGAERQDDFAPFLGIAQSQLSRIERGELAPSVEVLLRLRERFGKSVDWILTGQG